MKFYKLLVLFTLMTSMTATAASRICEEKITALGVATSHTLTDSNGDLKEYFTFRTDKSCAMPPHVPEYLHNCRYGLASIQLPGGGHALPSPDTRKKVYAQMLAAYTTDTPVIIDWGESSNTDCSTVQHSNTFKAIILK